MSTSTMAESTKITTTTSSRTSWILYAIASGICAALNGAFAKLTTTQLTTTWATTITSLLRLPSAHHNYVERAIRIAFLLLNLSLNGVMWGLFTRALTLAASTVRVSILNTSANFVVTALLGWVVFGEDLPGLWWIGAGMLVAGSVIIGRREEGAEVSKGDVGSESGTTSGRESLGRKDESGVRRRPVKVDR